MPTVELTTLIKGADHHMNLIDWEALQPILLSILEKYD